MKLEDLLSSSTLGGISTDLESYVQDNAQQYAQDQFLAGKIGQVYGGLQRLPESQGEVDFYWNQPGNVGNDPGKIGPQGPKATYQWFSGNSAKLNATGVPKDYANIYFYMRLPLPEYFPSRLSDCRTFQISDLTGWQALEFQSQISRGGKTWNMAYQANFAKKFWAYFDYTNTRWVPLTSIPLPDFTKPVRLVANFSLNSDETLHHSLEINDVFYLVEIAQKATLKSNPDKLTTAVQIDTRPNGLCSLQILDHEVRYL